MTIRRLNASRLFIQLCLALANGTLAAQVQQTGDVAKRGLKPADFPRTRQLVPGVYSYEALRAGDPGGQMTTVSLIVISNDGVLVADGQGNVEQTKEMVDWIKKTTTPPEHSRGRRCISQAFRLSRRPRECRPQSE